MITAVIDLTCGSTDKLVLLILANYADDNGDRCFPSVATLQRQSGLSERTIRGSFSRLEKMGYMEVIHRTGHSNRFKLTPAPGAPTPAPGAPPPLHLVHPTPAPGAPISVKDPSFEPSKIRRGDERPLETVGQREESRKALRHVTAIFQRDLKLPKGGQN